MCGRVNIYAPEKIKAMLDEMDVENYPLSFKHYNIPPGTFLNVIHDASTISLMPWGIEFGDFRHPNTKVETIKRKPFLQKLLLEQRCLVPVNRFYEWPDPKVRPKYQGIKTRFCIHAPDDVMFLGGIYKLSPEGLAQFNVLTTDPNERISDFHHRMPVIIHPAYFDDWFNAPSLDDLYPMMGPYIRDLVVYPCSAYVDNGRHEGPQCMAPLGGNSV